MDLSNCHIGFGITGSFCTFAVIRKEIKRLVDLGAKVTPVFSYETQRLDTRFGSAKEFVEGICLMTESEGIRTIPEAEPIGPNPFLDVMVIAPCTGNTAGKLAAEKARYESLTFQLENNFYDNDNDIGKAELMAKIQDWNEDLARGKAADDNIWIDILYPEIFEDLDFIELKGE